MYIWKKEWIIDWRLSQKYQKIFTGITKDDPIFKQLTPDYKLVFLLLLDRLKNEKRIKMSEFHDNKYLQRDIIDVIKKINIIREGMLSNPDNKIAILRADMFEGIFFDLVKNFKLLGEDFSAIMPCIYDDLFNGVDIILRENVSKRANSYIVAGIDLTIGGISYSKKLEAQINRVRRYDYSGNKVNYFKSEDNRFKGLIRAITRVCVVYSCRGVRFCYCRAICRINTIRSHWMKSLLNIIKFQQVY